MSAHEIPMKAWRMMVCEREGITDKTFYKRLHRGEIVLPPTRRINARVIFVQVGPVEDERQLRMRL